MTGWLDLCSSGGLAKVEDLNVLVTLCLEPSWADDLLFGSA